MSDDSMQAILAALGTTLGRLEAGQARLEAGQTKLEDGQARLESGMATLATRDELIQVRTDIMARMDTHANELRAIHDSIDTNYGASDHALQVNSNTHEDVRSLTRMVTNMRRELARLQTEVRELKGPL